MQQKGRNTSKNLYINILMRPGCVTYATPDLPGVAAPNLASDQHLNLKLGAAAD